MRLLTYTITICLFTFSLSSSYASPGVSIKDETIMIERSDVTKAAEKLSEASELFVDGNKCGSSCDKSLKKFAKNFTRILTKNDVQEAEQAQQILALVMTESHNINQSNSIESVRNLFLNEDSFSIFQKSITDAINKRKYHFWQKALLVVAGIVAVVVTGGVGFYIGGMMMFGLTWEIAVVGTIGATIAGTGGYYLIAKPINQNYSHTRVEEKLIKDLDAYLESIEEKSSDLNKVVIP